MGYHTDFFGEFTVTPTLQEHHKNYLMAFNETRRMKRNPVILEEFEDPLREAVGLPIGIDGEYFVNGSGFKGQGKDRSIIDYNIPPKTQPGLWCGWTPSGCGNYILWNEMEKFYDYIDWLSYIILNFLITWGYKLNGEVEWQGEDRDDIGLIIVEANLIHTKQGRIVFE